MEQFLLGQVLFKHKSAVLKELSERPHDSKVWTSERLKYWIKKSYAALSAPPSSKRAAETLPSNFDITEGFAVGTDDSLLPPLSRVRRSALPLEMGRKEI